MPDKIPGAVTAEIAFWRRVFGTFDLAREPDLPCCAALALLNMLTLEKTIDEVHAGKALHAIMNAFDDYEAARKAPAKRRPAARRPNRLNRGSA
jgi:hypothetical protein